MDKHFIEPFTDEKLVELENLFRARPTYKEENGGTVSSSEVAIWCEAMGLTCTEEQIVAYQRYWEKAFDGVIPFNEYMSINRNVHDTAVNMKDRAAVWDKDGNGYISADEFEELKNLIVNHDKRFRLLDFAHFVQEADIDGDGRVSVDELSQWMAKYLKDKVK